MSKARDIADLDFNSPDIDGGNIDGATIGGTTPAAGTFTGMKVNGSFTVNGNVDTSSNLGEVLQLSQTDSAGGFLWSVDRANNTYKHMTYHASRHKFYSDASTEMMSITSSGIDVTGAGTFSSTVTSTGLTANVPSGNGLLINSADIGTIKLKANSGGVKNWGFAHTNLAAGDFGIYASNSTGGDPITAGAAKLYFTSTGAATFSEDVTLAASKSLTITSGQLELGANYKVRWGGSNNYSIMSDNNYYVQINADGEDGLRVARTESTFNEGGIDRDFRVESDGNTHMLFVDGGTNHVGIGTSSPQHPLSIRHSDKADPQIHLETASYGNAYGVKIHAASTNESGTVSSFSSIHKTTASVNTRLNVQQHISSVSNTATSDYQYWSAGGSEQLRISGGGSVSVAGNFNTNGNTTFSGNVGIGGTPTSGGSGARWLTLDTPSTNTYSGGTLYKINGATKAYHYVENDYIMHQTTSGMGQKFYAGTSVAMTLDSSGRLSAPYQPSWGARSLSNANSSGGTANANETLVFASVKVNTGNHYNNSTGLFTAPVAGRYFVTFSGLYNVHDNTTGPAYIRVNSSEIYRAYHDGSGTNYEQISVSGVVNVAANDTISIYSVIDGWHVGGETSFSGYFIG
jgi:hypothetical protein